MNTRFALRPYDKITSERLEHAGILRPIAQALAARGIRGPEDLLEDLSLIHISEPTRPY